MRWQIIANILKTFRRSVMEQKVFIVGLGLIGSSLALAIKSKHPKVELSGFDLHETTVEIAVKKGIVTKMANNFAQGALDADIIILAVPVFKTMSYFEELAKIPLK